MRHLETDIAQCDRAVLVGLADAPDADERRLRPGWRRRDFPDSDVWDRHDLPNGHKAAHLAGIEQPVRIDLTLETELIGVGALVPAAVLERANVRIGDH